MKEELRIEAVEVVTSAAQTSFFVYLALADVTLCCIRCAAIYLPAHYLSRRDYNNNNRRRFLSLQQA